MQHIPVPDFRLAQLHTLRELIDIHTSKVDSEEIELAALDFDRAFTPYVHATRLAEVPVGRLHLRCIIVHFGFGGRAEQLEIGRILHDEVRDAQFLAESTVASGGGQLMRCRIGFDVECVCNITVYKTERVSQCRNFDHHCRFKNR